MKHISNLKIGFVAFLAVLSCSAFAWAGDLETKQTASTSATACTLTFAPAQGRTVVRNMQTSCDSSLGAVTFYARSGNPITCTEVDASALVTCTVVNTSYPLTNADTVVYVYANGAAPEYRTISAASTTAVVLSAALTGTTGAADKIYEVSAKGKVVVGANGAGAGTNTLGEYDGPIFSTPADSPLYVSMSSTTNTSLQVTVEK